MPTYPKTIKFSTYIFSIDRVPSTPVASVGDNTVLLQRIEGLMGELSCRAHWYPTTRRKCLARLARAQRLLAMGSRHEPDVQKGLDKETAERMVVARQKALEWILSVEAELDARDAATSRFIKWAVLMNVVFMVTVVYAIYRLAMDGPSSQSLVEASILGVPGPILAWSVVGACAAVLSQVIRDPAPGQERVEAWYVGRLFSGTIMGVIAYFVVRAGLVVVVRTPEIQAAELLWLVAFLGSYNEGLSAKLLHMVTGRLNDGEGRSGVSTS